MTDHNQICPLASCECTLIAKVRVNERARIARSGGSDE